MTRLGDPSYGDGGSQGIPAKFSPDGKKFLVVLRKGNLEANTNEYSLILFDTDEIFNSPRARVLVAMASSSNRPAIQNIVWQDDNDTVLFLGEHQGETTQLYSVNCASKELKKLTHHETSLVSFVAASNGTVIVFVAEGPDVPFVNENTARDGIVVGNELLFDLIVGIHGGDKDADYAMFVKRAGSEVETRVTTEGRLYGDREMALSPDRLSLILTTEATHVPDDWTTYDDDGLKAFKRNASAAGAMSDIRARSGHRVIAQQLLAALTLDLGALTGWRRFLRWPTLSRARVHA